MDPLWIGLRLWFDLNQYKFYKTRQIRDKCNPVFWSILRGKYTRKPWLEMTILINGWSKGGKSVSPIRWMVFFRSQCAPNVNRHGLSINTNTLSSPYVNCEWESLQQLNNAKCFNYSVYAILVSLDNCMNKILGTLFPINIVSKAIIYYMNMYQCLKLKCNGAQLNYVYM